jgi:hypothetical protein
MQFNARPQVTFGPMFVRSQNTPQQMLLHLLFCNHSAFSASSALTLSPVIINADAFENHALVKKKKVHHYRVLNQFRKPE